MHTCVDAWATTDKNRDTIPESASALLAGASIAHVAQLFPEGQPAAQAQAAQGGRGGKGRSPTVGAQFKNQLLDLVATLSATYPYYVRCLKPNPQKKPSLFDSTLTPTHTHTRAHT
jgi:myosin X